MKQAWLVFFLTFLLLVIFFDLKHRRVPNKLIVTALAIQLVTLIMVSSGHMAQDSHSVNITTALIGLAVGFIFFAPLWHFRAIGAGDVKFFATLGFFIGLSELFPALVIGSVLAGVHSLAAIFLQGWTGSRAIWQLAPDIRRGIPYAAYVAFGALFGITWLAFNAQPWLTTLLDS